ncbi:MAG TPA: TIGR00730 family Rossman fold protein [Bacteroidetes bacterium]|nr:TIGR00730 family Rossman fold protein [Bacteroidota bacterium]
MNGKKSKKAYENLDFMHSSDGRVIRLLAEYLEPKRRLRRQRVRDTIVFYGSARSLPLEIAEKKYSAVLVENRNDENDHAVMQAKKQLALARYYEDARELAKRLTEWSNSLKDGHRFLICSGGGPGMMEAANRGAREAGGKTLGFNISLPHEQFPNPYISPELSFEFHYFFMRKFWFMYLAKALVVFPGGFGTMDELFEVLTLVQTKKLQKEISVLIYGKKYWHDVIDFRKFVEWGTIHEEDFNLIHFADTVDEAYDYLTADMKHKFLDQRKFWYL